MGAWITYGLGSPNHNLPGYVVIHDRRGAPQNGGAVWSNGFLPTFHQGIVFRPSGTPILHLRSPQGLGRDRQRKEFDLIKWLNENHLDQRPSEVELEARIHSYELAFRMQTEATDVVELIQESADCIGYVHVADVPGRHEPGTGEINYPRIAQAFRDIGYEGTRWNGSVSCRRCLRSNGAVSRNILVITRGHPSDFPKSLPTLCGAN